MATTTKKPWKEKRGTLSVSPSPSPSASVTSNSINKKSSKPISSTRTTPTSSCDHERPTTPTNPKPIPNYLKPTICSLPKRSSPDSSALAHTLRPGLSKVRSFDKGHQVSKPIRGSTTTTTGANKETIRTIRSSSFSSRSLISSDNRLPVIRNNKASKVLKRTVSYDTNKNDRTSTSSTNKPPKSIVSVGIANDLGTIDHHKMIIMDDDDQELQSLPEISEMLHTDQELGDPTNIEEEEEDHDHKGEVEQQEFTTLPPPLEESHDDDHGKEIKISVDEKIDQNKGTDEENPTEEIIAEKVSSAEEEVQGDVGEDNNDKVEQGARDEARPDQDVGPSEKFSEEEEEAVSGPVVIEEKLTSAVKTRTGKRENQQAYNDVIEETSRKLMENKNKVRALAGAFETVISLQDKSPAKH